MLPKNLLNLQEVSPLEAIIPRNKPAVKNKRESHLSLNTENLKSQSIKRIDANRWKFLQEKHVLDKETSRQVAQALKLGSNIQELHLEDSDNDSLNRGTKLELSHIIQGLKSLSSLQTISLKFLDCSHMTYISLSQITQGAQEDLWSQKCQSMLFQQH